ncbi:MAG: hypothetical protein AMDU5_GPLC00014G0119 [Thermoplasmatales archaeon Gpl]|nr:MAG: hypothetical protein AMDU5_GPLC00014G0119 [Thermoplasmatales archaeon Gpl]
MHFTKKEIYGVISIVVVIIVVVSGIAIYSNLTKNTAPVPLSKYVKISNNDLLSNGQNHIYFISWYGCPIGADNSWVLYSFLNSTRDVAPDVVLHKSIAGTPALLFLNGTHKLGENISFNYAGVPFEFTSLYMYNETLTGGVYNNPISNTNSSRIGYALSVLKGNLPESVYQVADKYETQVRIQNQTGSWSASTGHLVTMLIVTGPDGTFVHFWFMYPSFSSNVSPQTVFKNLSTYPQISNAEEQFLNALGGSNVACA